MNTTPNTLEAGVGIQPAVAEISKIGTTPAEQVEKAGNAGGGITSFREELSNAENQFDSVAPADLDRFKLPEETSSVFSSIKLVGYNSFELKTKIKKDNDLHSGDVWVGTKAEGVPD